MMRTTVRATLTALAASAAAMLAVAPTMAQPAVADGNGGTLGPSPRESASGSVHADDVHEIECTWADDGGDWDPWCSRDTTDGDAGGVSGFANVHHDSHGHADIEFKALGDKLKLNVNTRSGTRFTAWVKTDDGWNRVFHRDVPGGQLRDEIALDLPEGLPVWVRVDTEWKRAGAANGTLVS